VGRNVLRVSEVPAGAVNLNVEGRRVVGALQGFGQLWQKTYSVRLAGVEVTPEEVCVDPKLQWFRAGNVWHNAGLRSVVYTMFTQVRKASGLIHRRIRS